MLTHEYAFQHDTNVAACLQRLLGLSDLPAASLATAHLPLSHGGLGLISATVTAQAAYWASWADTLPVLHQQLPNLTATLSQAFGQPHRPPPAVQAEAAQTLRNAGWQPPHWPELTQPVRHPCPNPLEVPLASRGWQHRATSPIHDSNRAAFQAGLDPASRAMFDSRTRPFASRAFTTIPYGPEFTYPADLFRILLLRRLRQPAENSSTSYQRLGVTIRRGSGVTNCTRQLLIFIFDDDPPQVQWSLETMLDQLDTPSFADLGSLTGDADADA
eukprot:Skav236024  [mRNA]  locus=scaffold1524:114774:125779:- [translate_table: standard]